MRTKILIIISALCLSGPLFAADNNNNNKDQMTAEQKAALKERAQELNSACAYPDKPSIPDGRNSTQDEMLQAQARMKAFIADGNDYIACLDKQEKTWGDDATKNDHQLVVVLHNKAVDDMQSVADLFNQAVRAYKGKK